ncbi:hypothetical protein BKA70DRAFT_1437727 [Coprinopsis sp. MPI-PUGE-AT-0042]|nr:hypothetical protein BKA70DRAFT_1437727 [Coprinopsis sp. MPI-PUGE-AT-0042]
MQDLHKWRTDILARDRQSSSFSADGLLGDELVELLSSVGPLSDRVKFNNVLAETWYWFPTYGDELFNFLKNVDIPERIPKPRPPAKDTQSKKDSASSKRTTNDDGEKGRNKRPRTEASIAAPSTPNPVASTSRANLNEPLFLMRLSHRPTPHAYSTATASAPPSLSLPNSSTYNPYMAYLSSPYPLQTPNAHPSTPSAIPQTTPVNFDAMWYRSYRTQQWQTRTPAPTRRPPPGPPPPPTT